MVQDHPLHMTLESEGEAGQAAPPRPHLIVGADLTFEIHTEADMKLLRRNCELLKNLKVS
jgi:hypothetical protein